MGAKLVFRLDDICPDMNVLSQNICHKVDLK